MTHEEENGIGALHDEPGGELRLGQRMLQLFDRTLDQFEHEVANEALPRVYVKKAYDIVRNSGAGEELERWKAEARRSNAGARPLISLENVLVLFLAHALAGLPLTYSEFATTLRLRLNWDSRTLLGISHKRGTQQQWYDRMWAAVNRVVVLIDPYPAKRNKILKGEEWAEFRASTDKQTYKDHTARMLERFEELVNSMVRASVRELPADVWNKYDGEMEIDATKVESRGRANPTSLEGDRSNPDPFLGRYKREGTHEGKGAGTDVPAYELETAVMAWNKPGEKHLFPFLVTAVTMHAPGKLSGHGYRLIEFHKRYGFDRFTCIIDRAYNGGTIDSFHAPARLAGVELVIEYKVTDLGLQGWFEDLILVDGNWYVNWMPLHLITASRDLRVLGDAVTKARRDLRHASHRDKLATEEQIAEDLANEQRIASAPARIRQLKNAIHSRSRYRMKEHGRVDSDGAQRFRYPDPADSLVTPQPLDETRNSITIPLYVPEVNAPPHLKDAVAARANLKSEESKPSGRKRKSKESGSSRKLQPLKHLQKYPYLSDTWEKWKGMRSLVEASNRLLKMSTKFNIEDPDLRSGRGFSFTFLATALAVVADNIHRIRTFFYRQEAKAAKPTLRARRRKDANGRPLTRRKRTHAPPS